MEAAVSEATVINNAIPDGWYEDPAKPNMQRWWAGNAWTEHVRYAEKSRPSALTIAPPVVEAVEHQPSVETRPFFYDERPPLALVELPAYDFASAPAPDPQLESFYVPMARFDPHSAASVTILPQRRRGRAITLWVVAVAVIGAAAGVALWVFLPH